MGLAFTPYGKFIVSAGHDRLIRLWDWRAGKTVDDSGSAWASAPTRSLACITRVLSRRETADELLYTGQDGLLIAREGPVVGAVELDKSRLRDVASEMAAGADANSAVAATVEHQGRRGISPRRCRTSVSRNASSRPLRAPGLDAARSKPAHQALA